MLISIFLKKKPGNGEESEITQTKENLKASPSPSNAEPQLTGCDVNDEKNRERGKEKEREKVTSTPVQDLWQQHVASSLNLLSYGDRLQKAPGRKFGTKGLQPFSIRR